MLVTVSESRWQEIFPDLESLELHHEAIAKKHGISNNYLRRLASDRGYSLAIHKDLRHIKRIRKDVKIPADDVEIAFLRCFMLKNLSTDECISSTGIDHEKAHRMIRQMKYSYKARDKIAARLIKTAKSYRVKAELWSTHYTERRFKEEDPLTTIMVNQAMAGRFSLYWLRKPFKPH